MDIPASLWGFIDVGNSGGLWQKDARSAGRRRQRIDTAGLQRLRAGPWICVAYLVACRERLGAERTPANCGRRGQEEYGQDETSDGRRKGTDTMLGGGIERNWLQAGLGGLQRGEGTDMDAALRNRETQREQSVQSEPADEVNAQVLWVRRRCGIQGWALQRMPPLSLRDSTFIFPGGVREALRCRRRDRKDWKSMERCCIATLIAALLSDRASEAERQRAELNVQFNNALCERRTTTDGVLGMACRESAPP
ncbi:hypothetical protein C8R44DRAFT_861958 [Mycena epipterygia]|nr:hypothetical protein C8R44DRAFT_861958 [Mycena epipterygia]